MDTTATPETGPVGASASIDDIMSEFETGESPTEAVDDIVSELVKDTEDEGEAKAPDAEESATDPTDEAEEAEEAPPEEDDDAETDDTPAEDPVHKVKVNGEEVEVPLSELLKGYSRTEDYKAKTMALADERREVEARKATVERDVQLQYANELKQQVDAFEALDPVLAEARQIDWERLKAEDPATFVQLSDAVNNRIGMIEQHRAKIAEIEGQRAQTLQDEAQAEAKQRMEQAANKIVELMPELAEGNAFQEFANNNIGALREYGFTPEEISEAVDDRVLIMADKARRWDALQKAKTGLPAKKIVPKSQVKSMTSDASDSSRSSRVRFNPNASRDSKLDALVNAMIKD
jgi:hypothetical protein